MEAILFETDRWGHPVRYVRKLVSLAGAVVLLFVVAGISALALGAAVVG